MRWQIAVLGGAILSSLAFPWLARLESETSAFAFLPPSLWLIGLAAFPRGDRVGWGPWILVAQGGMVLALAAFAFDVFPRESWLHEALMYLWVSNALAAVAGGLIVGVWRLPPWQRSVAFGEAAASAAIALWLFWQVLSFA